MGRAFEGVDHLEAHIIMANCKKCKKFVQLEKSNHVEIMWYT